jgi:UDP-N-acetylenolpyruvoylglucosamine reductase
VIGGGFNCLAPDPPIPGVVIQLSRFRRLEERPDAALRVEAGVSHSQLTRFCCDRGTCCSASNYNIVFIRQCSIL